jgi:hypothetical protein
MEQDKEGRPLTSGESSEEPPEGPPGPASYGGGRGTDYEWEGRESYRPETVEDAEGKPAQRRLRPAYGARHDPPLSKGYDSDNNPPAQGPLRDKWDFDDETD